MGAQRAMLAQYVREQPDMQLYRVYEDVNYSGTTFDRPAFVHMMEDMEAGRVDCVVVRDLSRFGRSFEETGHYLERVFPLRGVRFVAVGDGYDSLTATVDERFLAVPLRNLMNEVFARDISKKVQTAFRAKQQRGEFCGSFAPYGYIKEGTRLVVDPEAAKVVQQIYAWRLAGLGSKAIARELNAQGVAPPGQYRAGKGLIKTPTDAKTRVWHASAVRRVLANPAYSGTLALGRYRSNFLRGGGVTQVHEDDWCIFKEAHPAIVTEGAAHEPESL